MKDKLCIALGDFDGVHLGHQLLLNAAVNNSDGLVPAVYTFTDNCKGAKTITTRREKEILLLELGIKRVIFSDFNSIKTLEANEFVQNILFEKLNAGAVVCGRDFRFGCHAAGDVTVLNELCNRAGVKHIVVDQYLFTGKKLSSSDIRKMIECGDMETASMALGRRFSVTGKVIHGKRLGSMNNIPTVNIPIEPDRVVPAYGVYITKTVIGRKEYNGVSNIGVRPSVENTDKPNIETNLFDFDDDIYGKEITVQFIKMLRPERKFKNSSQLFEQIEQDIASAEAYFNGEDK